MPRDRAGASAWAGGRPGRRKAWGGGRQRPFHPGKASMASMALAMVAHTGTWLPPPHEALPQPALLRRAVQNGGIHIFVVSVGGKKEYRPETEKETLWINSNQNLPSFHLKNPSQSNDAMPKLKKRAAGQSIRSQGVDTVPGVIPVEVVQRAGLWHRQGGGRAVACLRHVPLHRSAVPPILRRGQPEPAAAGRRPRRMATSPPTHRPGRGPVVSSAPPAAREQRGRQPAERWTWLVPPPKQAKKKPNSSWGGII